MRFSSDRPSPLAAFASLSVVTALAGCPADGDGPGPEVPASGGDGVVIRAGAELAHTVDPDESRLLVLVEVGAPCPAPPFHSHAFRAGSVQYEFTLDEDDPSQSVLTARVAAGGLVPDAPEDRAVFSELDGKTAPSEGDLDDVRASAIEQLQAEEHPILVFSASDLSTLDGAGTATLEIEIAGETSTQTFDYTATRDGDVLTLAGRAAIDAPAHGMPNGALAACIAETLPIDLEIVVTPGARDTPQGSLDGGVTVFEPTIFPYQGGCDDDQISFHQVRDVVVQRCAGCHSTEPQYAASVPLVTYDDFRTDTRRNPGVPLFELVGESIDYDIDDDEANDNQLMPPPGTALPLTDDERQLIRDWVAQGGPDCFDAVPATTFEPVEMSTCGETNWADPIEGIVEFNCLGCHSEDGLGYRSFAGGYASGLELTSHDFYGSLNLWETSYYRLLDGSMPPYEGSLFHPDLDDPDAVFLQWVTDGYPEGPCE